MGPFNCNNSAHFNENALAPILEELKLRWTNVRANTVEDSFWKHEWLKHGTCAMQLVSIMFKINIDLLIVSNDST